MTAHFTPRILVLGGVLAAAFAAFATPVADPDYWWHVETGRYILAHGLPAHDLYTFTVTGHAWTDHEWLTEAGMALLHDALGPWAVSVAFAIVTWLGLVAIAAALPRSTPYLVAGAALFLAIAAGEPVWGPRAQMITFALSALELLWIRRYLEGRSRAITWFPLVMAAWANLHGGWVIGFAFLGVALVTEGARWLADRENAAARAHVRRLAVVMVLGAAAVMATPHGPALYLYPFQTQGSAAQQQLIVEWFSPDFHRWDLKPLEAMLLLLPLLFAVHRPSLFDVLSVLLGAALALQSVRHISLFIATATPVLAAAATTAWNRLTSHDGPWRRLHEPPPRPLFAATTALALTLIAAGTLASVVTHLSGQDRVTRESFPVGAADWLAAHPEVGTRMFNQYGWGGYLAYRFYPDPSRRVFVFGEAALMGDDQLRRYQDVASLRPDWRQVLDDAAVDYVVFDSEAALSTELAHDAGWREAYADSVARIYVRTR